MVLMLDALALWSRQRLARWLWLEVRASNTRAQQMYQHFGFKRVGHLEGVGFKFDRWLGESMCNVPTIERTQRLLHWDQAPSARACHPAEDHLVPLFVAVGAAEADQATRCFHQTDFFGSITASSFRFG